MVEKTITETNGLSIAEWPIDAPHPSEEQVISVVCGNTHLHWSVHSGKADNFAPILFWRTPPLDKDEQQDDPCAVLARHLPHQAHALIFGDKDAPASKAIASAVSAKRRIPAISIYVVTTNAEHEAALKFLFQDVTTRMVKLRNTDFSTQEQGLYDSMGVDRVAAVMAAKELYGAPVMVLDHGTAMTYTAMDRNEMIVGGGIAPGIQSRFRAMSDYCGSLPMIDHEKFNAVLKEAESSRKPLPIFATDTETAMITSVFSEVCNHSRCLVKHFLETVGVEAKGAKDAERKPETAPTGTDKEHDNKEGEDAEVDARPTIVVTGGDSNILAKMLENDYPSIRAEPGTVLPVNDYQLYNMKHLIHYGIGYLLNKKAVKRIEHPDDELRDRIIGLRVARWFGPRDAEGENLFRASVVRIAREDELEKDLFYVRYDDGDAEHCELKEIYEMLCLYNECGEKEKTDNAQPWVDEKKKAAKESADLLFEKSEKLRKDIEDEKKKKLARERSPESGSATMANRKRSWQQGDGDAKKPRGKAKKSNAQAYLGRRIAKAFEQENDEGKIVTEIFFGTIDKIAKDTGVMLWHVQYDDDDEEEFDEKDIESAIRLYQVEQGGDPKRVVGGETTEIAVVDASSNTAAPMETDEPKVAEQPAPAPPVEEAPKPTETAAPTAP
mmetsp:Transcript_106478/g.159276  ORF Transcript_106478/g.159276 Transcript_106478/m.159276 type:complete len:667 (-) Transcript_106478:119-2119(-)